MSVLVGEPYRTSPCLMSIFEEGHQIIQDGRPFNLIILDRGCGAPIDSKTYVRTSVSDLAPDNTRLAHKRSQVSVYNRLENVR